MSPPATYWGLRAWLAGRLALEARCLAALAARRVLSQAMLRIHQCCMPPSSSSWSSNERARFPLLPGKKIFMGWALMRGQHRRVAPPKKTKPA